jgi:hypothetical protein
MSYRQQANFSFHFFIDFKIHTIALITARNMPRCASKIKIYLFFNTLPYKLTYCVK